MKRFWIVFTVLALVSIVGLGLLWRFMGAFERGVDIHGGTLLWKVEDAYPEQRREDLLALVTEGQQPLLQEIIFGLRRAARDERIDTLLLEIDGLPADWAQVEELRDAVEDFRDHGKKVLAFLESGTMREYALACAADEIVLAPEGNLLVLGVSAEMSFLKGTLDKLHMQADFVHVGAYKSAPEMLTRSEASKANRSMVDSLIDDQYARLVQLVAAGRGVSESQARAWIDTGFYDAPTAEAAGLVDRLGTMAGHLDTRELGTEPARLADYARGGRGGRARASVALIHVTGTISPGQSHFDRFQGRIAGSQTIVERLGRARRDDGVAAVVLRVDSPGGSASASDIIWQEIARVRRQKPVFVSMGGTAASGGYYLSCGADSIFALPGTLTGSIGVFAGKLDMAGFYEMLGIHREFITRGENALLFSSHGSFTAAQRDRLQKLLDAFYERFVDKVASGRDLEPAKVAAIAQGRVWTGAQALENGLVDGLGGLERTIRAVKARLGLAPEQKVAVVTYERRPSFLEQMLVRLLGQTGAAAGTPAAGLTLLAESGWLAAAPLLDGQPLALMPWRIHLR